MSSSSSASFSWTSAYTTLGDTYSNSRMGYGRSGVNASRGRNSHPEAPRLRFSRIVILRLFNRRDFLATQPRSTSYRTPFKGWRQTGMFQRLKSSAKKRARFIFHRKGCQSGSGADQRLGIRARSRSTDEHGGQA
ncbi:unnamed protein product, partial [Nesidiocoris tenuis]